MHSRIYISIYTLCVVRISAYKLHIMNLLRS